MLGHHRGVAGLAPDALVDHVAVEDLPRPAGEEGHDVEVLAREGRDAPPVVGRDPDLAAREVHRDAAREADRGAVEAPALARELGAHAGAQDLEREGLGHVVVPSRGEAGDGVRVLDARREEDDGAGDELAHFPADGEAVGVGQVHVQQYDVGRASRGTERLGGAAAVRPRPLAPSGAVAWYY